MRRGRNRPPWLLGNGRQRPALRSPTGWQVPSEWRPFPDYGAGGDKTGQSYKRGWSGAFRSFTADMQGGEDRGRCGAWMGPLRGWNAWTGLSVVAGGSTPRQPAAVSQGRICCGNRRCCYTEMEVVDQVCYQSWQCAALSQGRICCGNRRCCYTEIEVANQTCHLLRQS